MDSVPLGGVLLKASPVKSSFWDCKRRVLGGSDGSQIRDEMNLQILALLRADEYPSERFGASLIANGRARG